MSKLDVEKICRLCCEKKSRMRSLFEQCPEYPLSLQHIIFDVSRLQIEPNDGMPQKICTWCATTLLKIHKSIENFRANDLKLRQQLVGTGQIEIKQEVEEEEEMDMEVLEEVLTHDLKVDDICVKREDAREDMEEYLDAELNDESEVVGKKEESGVSQLDDAIIEIEEEIVTSGKEDDEWKPTEQDTEDVEPPVKKTHRRRTKQDKDVKVKRKRGRPRVRPIDPNRPKRERDANGKCKKGRPRTKVEDPNRPRLRDYKCYICKSESHGSPEALIAHLNSTHIDKVPYTCPECVQETVVIKGVQGLNAHLRQHLNPEKCPSCDKRFSTKRNLALHVQTYHEEDDAQCQLKCKYCGEEYPSKGSLYHHMKIHTTAASCEICGKVFKERHKLRLHIQRRHEKLKKHECSICHKKLGSLDSVQMHIKTYHSNQVFKCSYCPKTYGSEVSHRFHEKKHIENPEYVSQKEWTEYYTVVEGQEDKQGAKKKKCLLCGTVTTAMFFHLSTTHFPTEYRCAICGDTFKRKQTYETHVLEHEYGKAHQCPICQREFSLRKNLIAHLRTKKHQDHPLAQSLDWLGISATKSKPRKPQKEDGDDGNQDREQIEDPELDVDI